MKGKTYFDVTNASGIRISLKTHQVSTSESTLIHVYFKIDIFS